MDINLGRLINAFHDLHVTVLGDPLLDVYMEGCCERLCREAPTPVVQVHTVHDVPGGAANVAVNAAALGATVRLLGLIGDDREGSRLRSALERLHLPADGLISVRSRRTIAKHRLIGDAQIIARFDHGTPESATVSADMLLCEQVRSSLENSDLIIVSDYNYGTVSNGVLSLLAHRSNGSRPYIIADGRDLIRLAVLNPTAVKPSFEEVTGLLDEHPSDAAGRVEWVNSRADTILNATSARIAAITLDREGAIVFERGRSPYRTYARPAAASRSTGSGDTFVAALGLALASGADTPEAAEIASAAAAVVTGKEGTVACNARDLHAVIAGNEKRLADLRDVYERITACRAKGQRIVFTNGCFDILHRGHVTMLNRAKGLGDILIVGLNSDISTRRLKGPGRPVNPLGDRVKVLAALSYVDYIVSFDADSPQELIKEICPDIYVKGGDYTRETLPESGLVESLGGAVCVLPLKEEYSTCGIIARIKGAA